MDVRSQRLDPAAGRLRTFTVVYRMPFHLESLLIIFWIIWSLFLEE
jgi:hypothetical protein